MQRYGTVVKIEIVFSRSRLTHPQLNDESTIEDITAEMELTRKKKQLTQAGQAF